MAQIYGVANPLALPAVYLTASGADVSCVAGSETNVITSGAITGSAAGSLYPRIDAFLTILLGATAPSALVIAFRLGAGADVDSFTVEPALLTNNAELMFPLALIGVSSASAWIGSGSTVNLTVKPTGQNVTVKGVGSRMVVTLLRASD
jgi:hypothetical protein